jgi:crossover junction endodeoxyribonuclease RuvC
MIGELCVVAFDPGLGGAIAFYYPGCDRIAVEDMPIADGNVDSAGIAVLVRQFDPNFGVVEIASSRPKQGIASAFKGGVGYGKILGVLATLGIATHPVSASQWKRALNLDSDKERSRARAIQYWPGRSELFRLKRSHGRAEACLLARFGAEKFRGGGS